MEQEKGTLIRWNNEKGFGFIRPNLGDKDIFVHVKSLPHYQRRPIIGDVLVYEVEVDEKGRHYASPAQITGLAWSHFTFVWGCLILLFGTYVYLTFQRTLPFHPLAIYAAMSLLTIWAYSHDKRAAQLGTWRTQEKKLHILEALGGWPGALLAQFCYRHKLQKFSYQIVFWLIVVVHGILWHHLLTHQEKYRPYQDIFTEKIETLLLSDKKTTDRLLARENSETSPRVDKTQKIEQNTNLQFPNRSTIAPLKDTLTVQGIVKEIRPEEGVLVSLKQGSEGMINKSTLVQNFPKRFKKGELIRVAVQAITFSGNQSNIELVLVDE